MIENDVGIRKAVLEGNEDLSQISASGLGRDFYWPPNPEGIERNYTATWPLRDCSWPQVASVVGPRGPQPGARDATRALTPRKLT